MPDTEAKIHFFICLSCGRVTDNIDVRMPDCCDRPMFQPTSKFGIVYISERAQELQGQDQVVPVFQMGIQGEEEDEVRFLRRTIH
jgi:hypothetical protein